MPRNIENRSQQVGDGHRASEIGDAAIERPMINDGPELSLAVPLRERFALVEITTILARELHSPILRDGRTVWPEWLLFGKRSRCRRPWRDRFVAGGISVARGDHV